MFAVNKSLNQRNIHTTPYSNLLYQETINKHHTHPLLPFTNPSMQKIAYKTVDASDFLPKFLISSIEAQREDGFLTL